VRSQSRNWRPIVSFTAFLLLAYAFMPDHAHFVIVPADGHTISTTMRVVKGGIARQINVAMGAKGPVWQDGFYDKVARTMEHLNAYIEYTHRNPVVAGLVSREAEYALSSADGRCMSDYQRFLNEPFELESETKARATGWEERRWFARAWEFWTGYGYRAGWKAHATW